MRTYFNFDRKNRLVRTALASTALLAAACANAETMSPKMNDLEIAHAAYTAGAIDIRYAHLAMALSDNGEVRAFAATMLRDHTAVNDAALELVGKLNVTPQDNAMSRALAKGAQENINAFRQLSGKSFDCAYAKNELGYHRTVNSTVEGNFIPNATVPELKSLLSDALATFRVHEGHAEGMVAKLDCPA